MVEQVIECEELNADRGFYTQPMLPRTAAADRNPHLMIGAK